MQETVKKIGILGGTFNPVHCGHLIIAEAVREKFRLDRVLFIPVGTPPHKPGMEVAEARHRFEMVKCAVSTNPYFEASRLEMDRAGITYTVDTLADLKWVYPEGTEFYFIIGADIVPELTGWKDYAAVFGMCSFIAVLRPGHDREAFKLLVAGLEEKYGARILTAETPLIDISSTDIRDRVSGGRSIKYLVPYCVEEYIIGNRLYMGLGENGHDD